MCPSGTLPAKTLTLDPTKQGRNSSPALSNVVTDPSSYFVFSAIKLKSGTIQVACYDWNSKLTMEKNWIDNLRVTIETKEYNNWLKSINPIYSD
mgnify:CR=1 FL=1